MNIEDMLNQIKSRNRIVIQDKYCEMNGPDFYDSIMSVSKHLASLGVQKGSLLYLRLSNDISSIATLFAAWNSGAVVFIGNPYLPLENVINSINKFSIQFLICDAPISRGIQATGDNEVEPIQFSYRNINITGLEFRRERRSLTEISTNFSEASVAIFSSGTTGEPKAILHSLSSILENAKAHTKSIHQLEDDITGCALPIFFSYGLVANLLGSLILGSRVILKNNISSVIDGWLLENKISVVGLTPYLAKNIQSPSKSIRTITIGGDALYSDTAKKILTTFHKANIYGTYGLTEAGPRVATCLLNEVSLFENVTAPLGKPIDCCEYYLDNNTQIHAGELIVRSNTAMLGYIYGFDKPAHIQHDNIIFTGDVFSRDQENNLFFLSRKKDLIVQSGEKIFPAAVEALIAKINGVADVRVFGVADDDRGQIAVANIQTYGDLTEDDIRRSLMKKMPANTIPKIIKIVEKIERSITGKKVRQPVVA